MNRDVSNMKETKIITVVLIIAAAAWLGLDSLRPPAGVSKVADATEFSAERAMSHISAIAQEPRPVGSPAHSRARQYIHEQLQVFGLTVEVQEMISARSFLEGSTIKAATVQNILARLPGSQTGKAVALMGHYDTVPMTLGASDNGAAVATLLETARALQAGPPLRNDVILIFTDEEEMAQLGVEAFVDHHPWAKDVGVVLNFEGIGNTGPSIMFETGPASGWLVREFDRTVQHPVAQSWLYDVYKLTPINTDFNKFSDGGYPGLNFAYMDGGTVYHTELDNPDSIDWRSLQHHGSYALTLSRHLGNMDLSSLEKKGGDAVYFSLIRGLLINYPVGLAKPLAVVVSLLIIGVGIVGFLRKRLTLGGIFLGLTAFLLSVLTAVGLSYGLWQLTVRINPEYQAMYFGRVYNAQLYLMAFSALTLSTAAALFVLFRKRVGIVNLSFGALLFWWIAACATSLLFPGMSYLFIWPLLFSLPALGWVLWSRSQRPNSWSQVLILVIGAVPGILIFAPSIAVMFQFAPTSLIMIPVLFVALLLGLLIPQLGLMTGKRRWILSGFGLLLAIGFLVAGNLTVGFNEKHPRPTAVAYLLNTDTGRAFWFSPASEPDEWTAQFFNRKYEQGRLGDLFIFPQTSRQRIITAEAPAMRFPPPRVDVMHDNTTAGQRRVRLRLVSARGAQTARIDIQQGSAVRSVEIAGLRIENSALAKETDRLWSLTYYALPTAGVEFTLELDLELMIESPGEYSGQVTDYTWAIPNVPGMEVTPRPVGMIPMPNFHYGTIVVASPESQ